MLLKNTKKKVEMSDFHPIATFGRWINMMTSVVFKCSSRNSLSWKFWTTADGLRCFFAFECQLVCRGDHHNPTRHDCSVINPNLQSVLINNQTFKVQNGCYTDNICSSLNSSLYYLPITVWHWQTSAFFWVIFRLNCRVGSTYARFSTWQHKTAGITRVHIPGLKWGQHL